MRLRAITALSAAIVATIATTTPAAAGQSIVAGGCLVQATAQLTPGLTLTSHPVQYSYAGTLSNCFYTGTGAANAGVISAGQPITIDGHAYQEPIPTGSGTCLITSTQGYDFTRWNNGTQTIVKFSTTSVAGVTTVTGAVVPSLQLDAISPGPGEPATATFQTTNFNGQSVAGAIAFLPSSPLSCTTTQGLTTATIVGALTHIGVVPPTPSGPPAPATGPMSLTSPSFTDSGRLPTSATCIGGATSPALQWTNVPAGTQSLELLVTDPNAPTGTLSHWVLYNIPPASTGAPAGSAPAGAQPGLDSFGLPFYLPPCPLPPGSTHHYVFELFASKRVLRFALPPTDSQVRAALNGNVLASATLVGTYALGA
jgi:Raf kinase inhibitor-like YbhB/YbcL family protein